MGDLITKFLDCQRKRNREKRVDKAMIKNWQIEDMAIYKGM